MALKEEIVGLICKTLDIEASELKDDEKLYLKGYYNREDE